MKHHRKKGMRPRVWLTFSHLIISLKQPNALQEGCVLSRLVVLCELQDLREPFIQLHQPVLSFAPRTTLVFPCCGFPCRRLCRPSLPWNELLLVSAERRWMGRGRPLCWALVRGRGFSFPTVALENLPKVTGYGVGELTVSQCAMAGMPFLDLKSMLVTIWSTRGSFSNSLALKAYIKKKYSHIK